MIKAIRILIIEDESGIALALYKSLSQCSYRVDTAKTGTSGLRKASAKKFDIILLDLGLPDMSGLTICKRLRAEGVTVPIIVLTGESNVKTKVTLLDAGANDYLVKPFSVEELQARLRACLRKLPEGVVESKLVVGELTLNQTNQSVERSGLVIPLRRKEFALLEYLMNHNGTAVTRATLMNYAWESDKDGWTNTVDVHIKHLRDKVDRPFSRQLIKTVHGIGYKLDEMRDVAKIS